MKNIVVAVWGENGCGKSTFSAALARALSERFSAVLLANADAACPGFALWGADSVKKLSLGSILNSADITSGYLRQNVTPAPGHECIGLMGYLPGESIEQYNPIGTEAAKAFFSAAREFSQVTIADCGLPQNDAFSYEAVNCADVVFSMIEPNRKGVAFYASMNPVFSALDGRVNYLVCAKSRSDSPVKEAENRLGRPFDIRAPYSEDAIGKFYECRLFEKYGGMAGRELKRAAAAVKEAADGGC